MRPVLFRGYFGHGNWGDEILLRALITGLTLNGVCADKLHYWRGRNLAYQPAEINHAIPRGLHGMTAWAKAGTMIFSGGIFYDHLPMFGSRRLRSIHNLIWMTRASGKKAILFGVSIGPLITAQGRRLTSKILKMADGIWVRDRQSYQFCQQTGVPCRQIPDLSTVLASSIAANPSPAGRKELLFIPCQTGLTHRAHIRLLEILKPVAQARHLTIRILPLHAQADRDLVRRLCKEQGVEWVAETFSVPSFPIQPLSYDSDFDGIPSAAPTAPPTIQVDGVSFSWPEADAPVLSNLSLTIPKGSQVGIVGPNGSGKSTLLAIITGVLKPEAGCVTIDDLPGGDYLQSHSSWISYVGPEPFLIQGSIRQNLMYSCNKVLSDDQLMGALDLVHLRTFVASLPEGLDYGIDESGGGLSSGQKQRLAIARAFLRRPKLLVMDEPTITIDNETETLLLSALKTFKGTCTMVIVSHKPEILRDADRIFEITPGKSGAMIKEIQSPSFKVGSTPSIFPER